VVTAPFRAHLALLVVEQLYSDLGLAPFSMQEETKAACRVLLPVRKHQVVQYARIPPGGGVGCP
jgi:hypothetical protein